MTNCKNLKIIICAGGTGGHMFPACSLFDAIKKRGSDVSIVTDVRGNIYCGNISQKTVLNTIRFSYKNLFKVGYYSLFAIFKFCKFWLLRLPDIVIGFGGIFTVIPLLIAKVFGSKIVIYEQNSIVGRANKFLEKFADLKLTSFKLENNWKEIPPPVRKEFVKNTLYRCDKVIKVLVIGGSQGAMSFSNIVPKAIATLQLKERKNLEIIQQVSYGNIDQLRKTYEDLGVKSTLENFIYNVAEIMLDSQLVICRSGASTLSELSATGRHAILIPYQAAADNHQFYNALYYENKKAAWVLEEKNGIVEKLGNIFQQILQNRELLKTASSHMINDSIRYATDNFIGQIELI